MKGCYHGVMRGGGPTCDAFVSGSTCCDSGQSTTQWLLYEGGGALRHSSTKLEISQPGFDRSKTS